MTTPLYARKLLAHGGLLSLLLVAGSTLAQRPNILLITADDMNWDSVGVYGCPVEETTPNIDQLASEGIQFDYGYVQIAICTPSRQVMLSGSHSHQTMTRCFTALERVGPALPDMLKQNGYHIANINKRQNLYDWDTAIEETESGFGRDIPFHGEAVRGILETAGEKPWFIMANFNDPHRPFHGSDSERSWNKFDQERFSRPSRVYNADEIVVPGFLPDLPDVRMEMAQYYSSVRRADDGVGAILKALDESGQSKNTVVVFLSDHGIYNPWVDGITEVHNSDYTGSPTLLAMWEAAETVSSIKKRTDFHKYRILEELYNVRQDPHAYINVAAQAENRDRLVAMRTLLVDWMEDTDHPATELMKDPHNERLIDEYMSW